MCPPVTPTLIRTKAEEKWKAYHSDLYKDGDYIVTYENGKEAHFLPGSVEFFNLKRYKEEVGKDFKRIVLFLCTMAHQQASERSAIEEDILYESDTNEKRECEVPVMKNARLDPTVANDEVVAREMQAAFDVEVRENAPHSADIASDDVHINALEMGTKYSSMPDAIASLSKGHSKQFVLVVRRGATLQRQLNLAKGRKEDPPPPKQYLEGTLLRRRWH